MRTGAALVIAVLVAGPSAASAAPFDKSLYAESIPLTRWLVRDAPAEDWVGRKVRFDGVYLIGEGHLSNEIYATGCEGSRRSRPSPEVLGARCPLVYLGKLSPEDAGRRLEETDGRKVNVFMTVGQVIHSQFVTNFGMLEAANGAWVEAGDRYFYVKPDSRVFRVPGGSAGEPAEASPVAEPSGEPAEPPSSGVDPSSQFRYEYRSVRDGDPGFRAIGRTRILSDRTEFLVTTQVPEWFTIEGMTVWNRGSVTLKGGGERLCRSSTTPGSCVADLGPEIVGRQLEIETRVRDADGQRHTLSARFATLDTHPHWIGTPGFDGHREREKVERHSADEVTRLVRIETAEEPVGYRVDLPAGSFRISVAGIKGAVVKSVELPPAVRPEDDVAILIPIFFSVSPYFLERERGEPPFDWQEVYTRRDTGIVARLWRGLERAARDGVDSEFLVVAYGSSARLFGPFRLYPGEQLTSGQREHNDSTLRALRDHLYRLPPAKWRLKRLDKWVSDVAAPIHTLHDLYFRTYPGLVAGILVTDGWNNPLELQPRFQHDLWPERLAELNRPLAARETERILDLLDRGRGLHADEIDRYLEDLKGAGERAPGLLASYLRRQDPGGTQTLHPQKENRLPQLDAMFIPSAISLRREMQQSFSKMIREDYGGEIYRLFKLRKDNVEQLEEKLHDKKNFGGALTFAQLIRRVHDQARASYVVTAEIPNRKHDRSKHELRFRAVPPVGKLGGRLHYMPYYTSSRSVREKLPVLAGCPYLHLRLLAAHALRDYWDDPELWDVLQRRIEREGDPVVRKVLFESRIAIDLKRMQAGAEQPLVFRWEAYARLQALAREADTLPDPALARNAARQAGWYWTAIAKDRVD